MDATTGRVVYDLRVQCGRQPPTLYPVAEIWVSVQGCEIRLPDELRYFLPWTNGYELSWTDAKPKDD